MAFYKFYLIVQVLLMYQILPLVCSYQRGNRDMDSARIQNSSLTHTRQLTDATAPQPRLFAAFKGIFFAIKAVIKGMKFFTPEIKGGLCIVKYMLILEDPSLARLIDMDSIAMWVHTVRLYISDLINPNRTEEEANNLLTRQRIEDKLRDTVQYDGSTEMRGKNSNVDNLVAIPGDENLFAIPKNITNYANEGQSYDSVYPKCLRTSFRGKMMTNLPCDSGGSTNGTAGTESAAKSTKLFPQTPPSVAPKINHATVSNSPTKYYENELRIVNMVMNYMELQPDQLLNLDVSHCFNFYAFGLLTRLFDGFLRR